MSWFEPESRRDSCGILTRRARGSITGHACVALASCRVVVRVPRALEWYAQVVAFTGGYVQYGRIYKFVPSNVIEKRAAYGKQGSLSL